MCSSDLKVTEIALAAGGNLAFPVIATIHGETLHNHHHGNTLKSGDLFLLDTGAETAMGYAGDLTSTFPVDRTFTSRQRDVYQIVLDAHLAAVAAVKPGKPFREIHLLACRTLAEGLKGLGLMKGDLDAAVQCESPVVALVGHDEATFCAGMSLDAMIGGSGDVQRFVDLLAALHTSPKPLLAVVDGEIGRAHV